MAEFSKFGPVVLVAVQLPILLIVPVGEGFLAFGTPARPEKTGYWIARAGCRRSLAPSSMTKWAVLSSSKDRMEQSHILVVSQGKLLLSKKASRNRLCCVACLLEQGLSPGAH